jgi:hypothetical protein
VDGLSTHRKIGTLTVVDGFVLEVGKSRLNDESVSTVGEVASAEEVVVIKSGESVTSTDRAVHGGVKRLKSFCQWLAGRNPDGALRFNCRFVLTSA